MATTFFGGEFFGGEFFGDGSVPPVTPAATTPGGVRNKRRWALHRDGKYHYFPDLRKLEEFRRATDQIIVPRATEKAAKQVGHPTVKLYAKHGDFDRLREIEREIEAQLAKERDEEDFNDFMEFIKFI